MKVKKNKRQRSEQIQQVSAGLRDVLGMTHWRKEHPKATWAEIEAAVDEQIKQVRAQLLQDMVQMGESEEWSEKPEEERPRCRTCGKPLWARGEQTRYLQTNGGEAIKLTRTYGTCPECGVGFFPLDEELGLVSGGLTPRGEEVLARLSTWMPFESARELLEEVMGVRVSKATARRATLQTGEAVLAVCEAEVERLKQELPQAPAGAEKQAISGDGAFVHLVGGEWVEVKTLSIGEVTRNRRGEVCMQHLSYCSRLSDAASFAEAALVETHRRGLERATEVCAVQDGAEWLQGLVDYHRADAVRILDFAHAAEYVNEIGQAVQAAGGRLPAGWLQGVLHRLKHQGPVRVLRHLNWLAARYPSSTMQEKLTYLHKREAHMQYPTYQEAGWPIGSGSVESANKLVVEARLKGAGMRWGRQNVNPMLVLRNGVCNRRWQETWTTARAQRHAVRTQRQQAKSQQRLESACWFLVMWGVRVHRLSHPSVAAATATMAQALAKQPTVRPGSGYSWRKPFLRRPPSTIVATEELCAK
jgi:hypothetical protein